MSVWQAYLAGFAVLVWVSCKSFPERRQAEGRRARRWIELAAASFFLSTAYGRLGLPNAPIFTLCCDAWLCILLYCCGQTRWETALLNVFRFSLLLSLIHHFSGPLGMIGVPIGQIDHWSYVVGLEICNWVAMLVILDAAIEGRAPHGLAADDPGNRPRSRHSFAWSAARRKPPFFRTHR